jgi:nitrate reductase beta subunit
MAEDSFDEKGSCGFSFGNGCSTGVSEGSLFGSRARGEVAFADLPKSRKKVV